MGVYLRESRRTNKDGTVVRYLQLAHNERHPETGSSVAKVIHSFGRADTVDRDALARLVSSISRVLGPEQGAAAASGEVEVLDSRRLGGAWVLDGVWERLGIGTAVRRAAQGRRLDAATAERVVFALVAQRALEPGSKLAATRWVTERVAVPGCPGFSDDQAYRGMDFLLTALGEVAEEVFATTSHLLNLDVDLVLVDTTSTYWETEGVDRHPDQHTVTAEGTSTEAPSPVQAADTAQGTSAGVATDADTVARPAEETLVRPAESGERRFGHSKDHRPDLPQVVVGMAVTRDGIPIRCWTFPGSTQDTQIIRTVTDDLGSWGLHRVVWVVDRGFPSAQNRSYLTRGGGHYIHAEKLRHTNTEAAAALARAGRYQTVADNLRVKQVNVAPGGDGDGHGGARTHRFVVCHNPDAAARDAAVRQRLVDYLTEQIDGSDTWTPRRRDELVGRLKTTPGLARYLRRTPTGLLRVDQTAVGREAHLDGKWLLRTSDPTLTPEDLALAYKQLAAVERGWRDMKSALGLRPVFHYREDRVRAHVQLCWLALLLIRVIENATSDTWRNTRHELDRMHQVTLATPDGQAVQRSRTTPAQKTILAALDLAEPPRYLDFTTTSPSTTTPA